MSLYESRINLDVLADTCRGRPSIMKNYEILRKLPGHGRIYDSFWKIILITLRRLLTDFWNDWISEDSKRLVLKTAGSDCPGLCSGKVVTMQIHLKHGVFFSIFTN